mmetsp:Transcript_39894/g.89388  ORF Transcript_39894/g.89388 Transcript_39894/m.89388 type:complete len:250 (+) Transcript_39894:5808-6557(+)
MLSPACIVQTRPYGGVVQPRRLAFLAWRLRTTRAVRTEEAAFQQRVPSVSQKIPRVSLPRAVVCQAREEGPERIPAVLVHVGWLLDLLTLRHRRELLELVQCLEQAYVFDLIEIATKLAFDGPSGVVDQAVHEVDLGEQGGGAAEDGEALVLQQSNPGGGLDELGPLLEGPLEEAQSAREQGVVLVHEAVQQNLVHRLPAQLLQVQPRPVPLGEERLEGLEDLLHERASVVLHLAGGDVAVQAAELVGL